MPGAFVDRRIEFLQGLRVLLQPGIQTGQAAEHLAERKAADQQQRQQLDQ